jgi:hypothetical protein
MSGHNSGHKRRGFLTVAEVCADLRVTENEWEEWRKRGDTPLHLSGDNGTLLVRENHLDRWIESRTVDLTDPDGPAA